jgi:hypothetical protein
LYFYTDAEHTTLVGSGEIVNGLWTATIPDLYGARTLYPVIEIVDEWGSSLLNLATMTAPNDSTSDIALGTVFATGTEDITFSTAWDEDSKLVLSSPDAYPLSQGANEARVVRLNVTDDIVLSSIHWLIDGEDTGIEGAEFTLVATQYVPGVHYLAAEMLLNGAYYSRELRFRVMGPQRDSLPANVIELGTEKFVDAALSEAGEEDYFRVFLEAGRTYSLTWNDYYNGDGRQGADVKVSAYMGAIDGTPLFIDVDSAYSYPVSITGTGSYVYIKVIAFGWGWPPVGSYVIGIF